MPGTGESLTAEPRFGQSSFFIALAGETTLYGLRAINLSSRRDFAYLPFYVQPSDRFRYYGTHLPADKNTLRAFMAELCRKQDALSLEDERCVEGGVMPECEAKVLVAQALEDITLSLYKISQDTPPTQMPLW